TVSTKVRNEDTMACFRQWRGDGVPRVPVIGEAVKQNDWKSSCTAAFFVADRQDGGLDCSRCRRRACRSLWGLAPTQRREAVRQDHGRRGEKAAACQHRSDTLRYRRLVRLPFGANRHVRCISIRTSASTGRGGTCGTSHFRPAAALR